MRVSSKHEGYTARFVRQAARWAARQVGMDSSVLCGLGVAIGRRRNRHGGGSWGGYYHPSRRLVEVLLPKVAIRYPTSMAHTQAERAEGREATDEIELLVAVLGHELEHARAHAVARDWRERVRLNREDRVRDVEWRVLRAFRSDRAALVAAWSAEPAAATTALPAPQAAAAVKARPTVVERRARRASELLAAWERRLKMAKTKVSKYRRKVGYYERAARRKGGAA